MMTRRAMLMLLACSADAFGQGISSRSVKPQPRGKPSGRPFLARFTDVAKSAGLTQPTVYGSEDAKSYIIEVVGCGVAFLDYDNDGWLDLFVLNGTRLAGAPPGTTNRLYKNNRDGTFTDVTEKSGLTRTGWASGVTVGDYDNDGFDDVFITCYGHNVLYHNNGDGTFTDVTQKAGLHREVVRYGSGCTWVDYDRDGRLDLFVVNYLSTTLEQLPKPGENADCRWKGVPVNCGPRGLPTGFVELFHNNGDGTFTDVSRQSGVAAASGSYPMTAVAADYDNDGWADIYVACDSTPSWLFRNQHDGTFREEALQRGAALSEDGLEQAGMGVGLGDYDLDGNLDIFKTHFADDTNVLYRNDGKGNFDDVTIRVGLGVETRYVGWGAGMVDLDNDGLPDLFLVTGGVYPEVETEASGLSLPDPAVGVPQSGRRKVRGVDRRSGTRCRSDAHQPGLRVRGLRQRRGCRHPGDEHERAAVAAAQRRLGQRPLAESAARRRDVEPQCDWRARARPLRQPHPGAGGHGAIELLLGQRSPPPLRAGHRNIRGPHHPLAQRRGGKSCRHRG